MAYILGFEGAIQVGWRSQPTPAILTDLPGIANMAFAQAESIIIGSSASGLDEKSKQSYRTLPLGGYVAV